MKRRLSCFAWTAILAIMAFARADYVPGPLYDTVVKTLTAQYYDAAFRAEILPKIAAELRPRALRARSLAEERRVVHELLTKIPASHLGLLSVYGRDMLIGELLAKDMPTLGFQLLRVEAGYIVGFLLEGGPAARAGLKSGDRVVSIDGLPPERSPRLDWRTDDAYLDDRLDPPVHAIIMKEGERVGIEVERAPGRVMRIDVASELYSAFRGTEASIRTYEPDGLKIGYLHLWYVYMSGVTELLTRTLTTRFADHAAFVLDLRGRGGSGLVLQQILQLFDGPEALWPRPVVALVDRQSRSGKDVLAYEMKRRGIAKIVGEPTAGAAIPAAFADVGFDSILMFPAITMPTYTELLELKPTPPDVFVERAGAYAAGADPILERGIAEADSLAKATPLKALNLPKTTGPDASIVLPAGPPPAWAELRGRMVEALGGEAVLRRHRTLTAKGSFEIVNTSIKGTFEMTATAPDTVVTITDLPQIGRIEASFAAGRGESRSAGQPAQAIEARYAAGSRLQSLFFGPLQYDEAFSKIAVKDAVASTADRPMRWTWRPPTAAPSRSMSMLKRPCFSARARSPTPSSAKSK
jgi:carboxyl-terminal processing protease